MKALALLVLVAIAHVAFLFGVYGSGLFGWLNPISYAAVFFLWLVCSPVVAGWGYFNASAKLLGSTQARLLLSILAAAGSLYAGVYLALNTFGE
jgi:hypothetical protein